MDQENLLTPTQVIRSKRKSLSLQIKTNGDFIVRSPLKYSQDRIFKFINEKRDWIIKKRLEYFTNPFLPLSVVTGETINIIGQPHKIWLAKQKNANINNGAICIPTINSKNKLVSFLKTFAKKYISNRTADIAISFNFNYESVSISSAKTCWGSCSHNNKLHFTYRLIMCPKDVIDYIIIHELCHTKIKNHSKNFWQFVASCDPNYKQHEKWLKQNRRLIELI